MRPIQKYAAAMAVVSTLGLTAACGEDEPSTTSSEDSTPTADAGMAAGATLVGPGCDDYAAMVPEGAGSVEGMAEDPVAVAAGNNPVLKTLVAAVSGEVNPKVNLVDTLNGGEFTVFAPTDDAFAKIDKKTLATLAKPANADQLSSILTYHVVEGRIEPDAITGEQTSVQGDTLEVTGSGDGLKVDDANVVCGGVQTANATVYLVDSVLMPAM